MMCTDIIRLKDTESGQVAIALEMPQNKQDRARIVNYAYRFIGCVKSGQAQKRIQSVASAMDSSK